MLGSQEIGTLIKALGCGIGRDEYDPDKTRYHHIVIMTDADVDGSHIRTLLLTFFYRQMPELVERGYIYIAQPPLYKIKRGKQETYLKDDAALFEYLGNIGIDGASIFPGNGMPPIAGVGLEHLYHSHQETQVKINRLSRRYPDTILKGFISYAPCKAEITHDELTLWWQNFAPHLNQITHGYAFYNTEVLEQETESGEKEIKLNVSRLLHGVTSTYRFNLSFFEGKDYQAMCNLGEAFNGVLSTGAYVARGAKKEYIDNFEQAFDWLITEAKKGQNIQRYKGLGEMNPEQLWETTMDPAERRMLQVNVADAIVADQLFATLMGDHVEPRRDFIESNALNVMNLDV